MRSDYFSLLLVLLSCSREDEILLPLSLLCFRWNWVAVVIAGLVVAVAPARGLESEEPVPLQLPVQPNSQNSGIAVQERCCV